MKFLEGWLFRPQGKPMDFPVTAAAKLSQYPYRFVWNEAWFARYFCYSSIIMWAVYWQIDKKLTSKENKEFWAEKRKKDLEHHRHHLEKLWEVKT